MRTLWNSHDPAHIIKTNVDTFLKMFKKNRMTRFYRDVCGKKYFKQRIGTIYITCLLFLFIIVYTSYGKSKVNYHMTSRLGVDITPCNKIDKPLLAKRYDVHYNIAYDKIIMSFR